MTKFEYYKTDENSRPLDFDAFCAAVHKMNAKWWRDVVTGEPITRNKPQMLQLMLSEVSEAMEAERKSKPGAPVMDDKLPQRVGAEVEMADLVIRLADWCGGFGGKLGAISEARLLLAAIMPDNADADRGEMLFCISAEIVRIRHHYAIQGESWVLALVERYCKLLGYDLWGAVEDKLSYNLIRKDHSDAHRIAEGGKSW